MNGYRVQSRDIRLLRCGITRQPGVFFEEKYFRVCAAHLTVWDVRNHRLPGNL